MANQDMTLEEYQSRYAACKEVLKQYLQYAHGRDIVIWGTRENGRIAKEALEALGRESKFLSAHGPGRILVMDFRSITPMCWMLKSIM